MKVIDEPGTKHTALAGFMQDKWQARSNVTVDLGLRWEYTARSRASRDRARSRTTMPRPTRSEWRDTASTDNALNVQKTFTNFAPRTGASWRLNEMTVIRAGYGAGIIPFPDNRYAFNYPIKQNYSGTTERVPARRLDGGRLSGPGAAADSERRHRRGEQHAAQFHVRRHSAGAARGDAALLERRVPAAVAVPADGDVAYVGNRGVDLVMDVDTNAGMVYGAGNAGRPQFAQFNRTGTTRTRTNHGKSRYDGLQVKVDRRFRNGFLVTNSYTLSRSSDYVNENTTIGTPIDPS